MYPLFLPQDTDPVDVDVEGINSSRQDREPRRRRRRDDEEVSEEER